MKSMFTIKKEWRNRTYRKPKRKEIESIYTLIKQIELLLTPYLFILAAFICALYTYFFKQNWDAVRLFCNLFFSINKIVRLSMSINIDSHHPFHGFRYKWCCQFSIAIYSLTLNNTGVRGIDTHSDKYLHITFDSPKK